MDSAHVSHVKKKGKLTTIRSTRIENVPKSTGLLLQFCWSPSISSKIYLEESKNNNFDMRFPTSVFPPTIFRAESANMAAAGLWRRPVFVLSYLEKIILDCNQFILLQGVCMTR